MQTRIKQGKQRSEENQLNAKKLLRFHYDTNGLQFLKSVLLWITAHYNGTFLMEKKPTHRIFWKFKCYIFEAMSDNIRKQKAQFPFCFHFKGQKSKRPLASLKNMKHKFTRHAQHIWRPLQIDSKHCWPTRLS